MPLYLFRVLGFFIFLVCPSFSFAHTPSKGLAGFYTGILHVYSEASLVMALAALGLLIGQMTDLSKQRKLLVSFLFFITFGSVVSSFNFFEFDSKTQYIALWCTVVLVCLHAALLPKWNTKFAAIAVVFAGLILGKLTVPDHAEVLPFIVTLFGSLIGCIFGFVFFVSLVDFLYQRFYLVWQRTILRIVSAWLFAISFLLLAVQYASKNV